MTAEIAPPVPQRDPSGAVLSPHPRSLVGVGAGGSPPWCSLSSERLDFAAPAQCACSRCRIDLRRDGLVHQSFPRHLPGDHLAVPTGRSAGFANCSWRFPGRW